MLKVIAAHYVGPIFAAGSSIVFAVLLFSAVNTALADLVSIQFMLSRDKELPHAFGGLNRFGMPLLPLVVATIVPAVVVLVFPDVEKLAGLYAIGVVGAISINLGTTSTNMKLSLRIWERVFMILLTIIMIAVGITICIVKPQRGTSPFWFWWWVWRAVWRRSSRTRPRRFRRKRATII